MRPSGAGIPTRENISGVSPAMAQFLPREGTEEAVQGGDPGRALAGETSELKEATTGVCGESTAEERTWRSAEGRLRQLNSDQHMCVRKLPERKGKGSMGLGKIHLGLSQAGYQPDGKSPPSQDIRQSTEKGHAKHRGGEMNPGLHTVPVSLKSDDRQAPKEPHCAWLPSCLQEHRSRVLTRLQK